VIRRCCSCRRIWHPTSCESLNLLIAGRTGCWSVVLLPLIVISWIVLILTVQTVRYLFFPSQPLYCWLKFPTLSSTSLAAIHDGSPDSPIAKSEHYGERRWWSIGSYEVLEHQQSDLCEIVYRVLGGRQGVCKMGFRLEGFVYSLISSLQLHTCYFVPSPLVWQLDDYIEQEVVGCLPLGRIESTVIDMRN